MGNAVTTTLGDVCTCLREHENASAVGQAAAGQGTDIDDAVLAATSNMIDANALT